ncbi:hypothetical protein T08_5056 [Trichinella sp. T8]|nr:hypothetical protein T08_5056 [Trichinella sp. T8]
MLLFQTVAFSKIELPIICFAIGESCGMHIIQISCDELGFFHIFGNDSISLEQFRMFDIIR